MEIKCKITTGILFLIVCTNIATVEVQGKSVYAIADHDASTIKAYEIQGDKIVYQATAQNVPQHDNGAVDLTIDPCSLYIFVTYEDSDTIELINARTMIAEQESTVAPEKSYSRISSSREKAVLDFNPQAFDQAINSVISTRLLPVSQLCT